MNVLKLVGACALIGLISGCGDQLDVKYLICDIAGKNCITTAKFDTLETCERYKIKNSAYCDEVSVPGKIICDTQRKSEISTSYCTK